LAIILKVNSDKWLCEKGKETAEHVLLYCNDTL
jgi:hypothetical protein